MEKNEVDGTGSERMETQRWVLGGGNLQNSGWSQLGLKHQNHHVER